MRLLGTERMSPTVIDATYPELAVAILPTYANQGIGTQLLVRLLAAARELHPGVVLSVRTNNPAHRLYERLGFVVIDEIVNRIGSRSYMMKLDFNE